MAIELTRGEYTFALDTDNNIVTIVDNTDERNPISVSIPFMYLLTIPNAFREYQQYITLQTKYTTAALPGRGGGIKILPNPPIGE
jgi:hypothetical protein